MVLAGVPKSDDPVSEETRLKRGLKIPDVVVLVY
jgi:hypothetical protein